MYGSGCPSVRNAIERVRSMALPNITHGFAAIENRGKKQCSMIV